MEPSLATSQSTKKQKYDRIMEKKTTTPTDLLYRGSPNETGIFLNYTHALRFDNKPNSYLRKLFHDVFVWEGYQYDYIFDWRLVSTTSSEYRFPSFEYTRLDPSPIIKRLFTNFFS